MTVFISHLNVKKILSRSLFLPYFDYIPSKSLLSQFLHELLSRQPNFKMQVVTFFFFFWFAFKINLAKG